MYLKLASLYTQVDGLVNYHFASNDVNIHNLYSSLVELSQMGWFSTKLLDNTPNKKVNILY